MIPADRGRADPAAASAATARALAALDDLPVGALLLRPLRDEAGAVVDFVFAYVNHWAGYVGALAPQALVGRRVLEGPHAIPRELFEGLAATLETGDPLCTALDYGDRFAGNPEFSGNFQITASRLEDGLLVIYDDVAARAGTRSAEQRYGAVLDATSDWVSIA